MSTTNYPLSILPLEVATCAVGFGGTPRRCKRRATEMAAPTRGSPAGLAEPAGEPWASVCPGQELTLNKKAEAKAIKSNTKTGTSSIFFLVPAQSVV